MSSSTNDIAIIGMACRFPGANHYQDYWNNLVNAVDCISEIPNSRWRWEDYTDKSSDNYTASRWGGFTQDVDKFDSLFFKISPREASFIDPQHRVFIEEVWHAVEDAGYRISDFSGRKVGVYAGVSKNDYAELMRENKIEIASYVSTGTVHSILTNRVSYLFNFRGKSEPVDTACSSSLVALHNAIRDIRAGDTEIAIVGGVNLLLSPTIYISHSKSGMLSADGQCKTFDASANGYVRGEGVGVLVIRSLQSAVANKDNIHAVIKGSAINHGGRSAFLTSPNINAQAEVIQSALNDAALSSSDITYIEAHGTGTEVGDPIEINALKKVFADEKNTQSCCVVGSVKTNIGHLEAAAGMAGIIKTVLSMKFNKIPSIRNFKQLNPLIALEGTPFKIATKSFEWDEILGQALADRKRAGISSFGMGGVNAHVIVEEYSDAHRGHSVDKPVNDEAVSASIAFVFSSSKGRVLECMKHIAQGLRVSFANRFFEKTFLQDLAYTLFHGREIMADRFVVIANTLEQLLTLIENLSDVSDDRVIIHDSCVRDQQAELISNAYLWCEKKDSKLGDQSGFSQARRISIPGYAFQKTRIWYPEKNKQSQLPSVTPSIDNNPLKWREVITQNHLVAGLPILPGASYLAWAVNAFAKSVMRQENHAIQIRNVYWLAKCELHELLNLRLDVNNKHQRSFIFESEKKKYSVGEIESVAQGSSLHHLMVDPMETPLRRINRQDVYQMFKQYGLAYGDVFSILDNLVVSASGATAEYRLSNHHADTNKDFLLNPFIVDACFQVVVAYSIVALGREHQEVPYCLDKCVLISRLPPSGKIRIACAAHNPQGAEFLLAIYNDKDEQVATFEGFKKRPLNSSSQKVSLVKPALYFSSRWVAYPVRHTDETSIKNALYINLPRHIAHQESNAFFIHLYDKTAAQSVAQCHGQVCSSRNELEQKLHDLIQNHAINSIILFSGFGESTADLGIQEGVFLLWLVQALIKTRQYQNTKILSVIGQANEIGALCTGFYRTLKYENPSIKTAVVYSGHKLQLAGLGKLIADDNLWIGSSVNEWDITQDSIKIRQNFALQHHVPETKPVLRQKMTLLITGGAGGLGYLFSQYLAKQFQSNLVWFGRRKKSSEIEQKIAEIESLGVSCTYVQVDITDYRQVADAWLQLQKRDLVISGIIHAAGIIEDTYILKKSTESFLRVTSTKIRGAYNLHEVSRESSLDFFIIFSSIAAKMPNQGQCDYAAANNYLDAFAHQRNQQVKEGKASGRSLSINWPLWANGGMSVTESETQHLQAVFGMNPMETEKGLSAFLDCMAIAAESGYSHILVIDGDINKISQHLQITESSFNNQKDRAESHTAAGDVEATVLALISKFTENHQSLSVADVLADLNFDSVTLHSISAALKKRFQIAIDVTLFFEVVSIQDIVDKIQQKITASNSGSIQKEIPMHKVNSRCASLIDAPVATNQYIGFTKKFSVETFYLKDHVVNGLYNMPGACFVEMARQAAALMLNDNEYLITLTDNFWIKQLSSAEADFIVEVRLFKQSHLHYTYEISSQNTAQQDEIYATGKIVISEAPPLAIPKNNRDVYRALPHQWQPKQIYQSIIAEGLHVGETFMPMRSIQLSDVAAIAHLILPDSIKQTADEYLLHPSLLTGVFQTALICNRQTDKSNHRFIPIAIDEIQIYDQWGSECDVYCEAQPINQKKRGIRKFNLDVVRNGLVVASLRGFSIRQLAEAKIDNKDLPQVNSHQTHLIKEFNMDKPAQLLALLVDILSTTLEVPKSSIDLQTPFEELGVGSITVAEINQLLDNHFRGLSKTLLFEYRNLDELLTYLMDMEWINSPVDVNKITDNKRLEPSPAATAPVENSLADTKANLIGYLKSFIAQPLDIAVSEIDAEESFESYGINSVVIHEVNAKLETVFGELSKTLLFECHSISELANYFLQHNLQSVRAILPPIMPLTQQNLESSVSAKEASLVSSKLAADTEKTLSAEPIAIVGLAGRYPQADNLQEFWANLLEGRDCITETPINRVLLHNLFNENKKENRIYSKWGGFLNQISLFDNELFGISPREAELIDPQERLMLEVAWEALMDAGYSKSRLSQYKDDTGVYIGAIWQPYTLLGAQITQEGNPVAPSGLLYSIANRVSFSFDLKGPSMAVDTACSGSLTALHLACQSLRTGESKLAIAGGVNLSLHSSKYLFLSQNRFLSTDGKCRSFGAGGDGYVPGEGVGCVILKPLSLAIKDGDHIYGTILGSAINHGGRTNGYTVPDPKAQAKVIAKAFAQSGISPASIDYVEAHGTGTSLGDPIEIAGLEKVFKQSNKAIGSCKIGSVKSNIGHLEAAAGIAGLTKILLQYQHKTRVASLHADTLNPNIGFEHSVFSVQQKTELLSTHGVMRSSLSSFGAGGSNAHVIIESYVESKTHQQESNRYYVIPLSARTAEDLLIYCHKLAKQLASAEPSTAFIRDIAFTLQEGRDLFNSRVAFVVSHTEELEHLLNNVTLDQLNQVMSAEGVQDDVKANLIDPLMTVARLWIETGRIHDDTLQDAQIVSIGYPPFHHVHYWLNSAEFTDKNIAAPANHLMSSESIPKYDTPLVSGVRRASRSNDFYLYDTDPSRLDKVKRELSSSGSVPIFLFTSQKTRFLGATLLGLDIHKQDSISRFFAGARNSKNNLNFVFTLSQYDFRDLDNIILNLLNAYNAIELDAVKLVILLSSRDQIDMESLITNCVASSVFNHSPSLGFVLLDDNSLNGVSLGQIIETEVSGDDQCWIAGYDNNQCTRRKLLTDIRKKYPPTAMDAKDDVYDFVKFIINNDIDANFLIDNIATSEIE